MYFLVLSVGNFQAEEQNYVMSAATEDVEMADVEDDSDEEDAVAEELGK